MRPTDESSRGGSISALETRESDPSLTRNRTLVVLFGRGSHPSPSCVLQCLRDVVFATRLIPDGKAARRLGARLLLSALQGGRWCQGEREVRCLLDVIRAHLRLSSTKDSDGQH